MLIDRLLPHCDFYEHHSTRVTAAPERIYDVIRHGELTSHPIVRALLFVRGIGRGKSLDLFLSQGFVILAEDRPHEIVIGIEGPFWKPNCKLRGDLDFTRPVPNGVARAAWNFAIAADGTVSTETRILCADDARPKFRAYWLFVRPFSGLIRRMMLRSIRKQAE